MIGQWWTHYWHWAGSNIGALPAELVLTSAFGAVFGILFRKPAARFITWLRRDREAILEEAREDARKSRVIAADLYLHLTGSEHPHAPGRLGEG